MGSLPVLSWNSLVLWKFSKSGIPKIFKKPGTGGALILKVFRNPKPRGFLKIFKNLELEVLCFWEFSITQNRRFLILKVFKKNPEPEVLWFWKFSKTQNQRFFENFQKPETVGALILAVFKNPEPEVLWFWKFSKTQNQEVFWFWIFSQNLEPEVINKIKKLHNTGM